MSPLTLKASEAEGSTGKDSNKKTVTSNELKVTSKENSTNSLLVTRYSSLSSCVKCGSCKALCPTYIEDANEGMSARGRVILLNKFSLGEIKESMTLDKRIFSCMLCGACNRLCPLGINITNAIYEGRRKIRKFNKKRRLLGRVAAFGLKRAGMWFRILKSLEGITEVIPFQKIQPFKSIWDIGITLPESPLRAGASIFKATRPRGRIAIFTGCTVNYLYPDIGMALIKGLNKMHYDVIIPRGEVCCGAPLMALGIREDAAELAEKNLNIFKKLNVEAVIGICPTCVHFIKEEYKKLIGEGIDSAVEVSQFFKDSNKLQVTSNSKNSNELQVTSDKLKEENNSLLVTRYSLLKEVTRHSPLKIIYHDPCHSIYSLNVSAEPREILKSMGFKLIEPKYRGCCGFGGPFRFFYKGLSEEILNRRIYDYAEADMIVTSCPNCILQLKSKIKDKPVKHLAEVLSFAS